MSDYWMTPWRAFENKWDNMMLNSFKPLWDGFMQSKDVIPYISDDGSTIYEVEVPGFNKDNLEISIDNGILSIFGKRETSSKNGSSYKEINEAISINADPSDIDAEVKDGILYLTVKSNKNEMKTLIEVK
jgi:HSP20 family protein